MVLSDRAIFNAIAHKEIGIDPMPELVALQPASVDLTLGSKFLNIQGINISPPPGSAIALNPGQFFLGSTVERIRIPARMVARVEGKSSLGRMGIIVHATAGFIDPGFEGNITLEFANLSDRIFWLEPQMYICQISFEQMSGPAERPYGHPGLKSSYQQQDGTKESKYA